jgi:DNA repair exonuclease SbcCD ATPase subunit
MAEPKSALGATDYQSLSESNGPLIPCVLEESGSLSRAQKRKKDREASTRFRQRQKQLKEAHGALEGKDREIQTLRQEIQTLRQEIHTLREERDFYRCERNFLQQWVTQTFPSAQIPGRPVSPRLKVAFLLT